MTSPKDTASVPDDLRDTIRKEIRLNVNTALKLKQTPDQREALIENSTRFIIALIETKYKELKDE